MTEVDFSSLPVRTRLDRVAEESFKGTVLNFGFNHEARRDDEQNVNKIEIVEAMPRFSVRGRFALEGRRYNLWKYARKLLGKDPTFVYQQTGSCVGAAFGNVTMITQGVEITLKGDNEEYKWPWWPFTYGKGRQRGGMRGRGEGSFGAAQAKAALADGIFELDPAGEPDLPDPKVSNGWAVLPGSLEMNWSDGAAIKSNWVSVGQKHLFKTAAPMRSADDCIDALANGYVITCASMFGFSPMTPPLAGKSPNEIRLVRQWNAQWAHQMSWIEYWDHPDVGPVFGLLNNWGACYSDDTDVLTDTGWYRFSDLPENARIATLNPNTHALEYQAPTARMSFDYDGYLTSFNSRHVDALVTPNHKMYVTADSTNDRVEDPLRWRLVEAETCPNKVRVKKNAKWSADDVEFKEVGGYRIPMDDWLEFLGYYVTEGYCGSGKSRVVTRYRVNKSVASDGTPIRKSWKANRRSYVVGIAQTKPEGVEVIGALLSRLPFNFARVDAEWRCDSKALWTELSALGKRAHQKHLPSYVRDLSAEQSRILLSAMMAGDATVKEHQQVYYTSSPQLANDVQELLLKCGMSGDIGVTDRVGRVNAKGATRHPELRIGINRNSNVTGPNVGFSKLLVPYTGKVSCVTVPNHVIYVRRNGKPFWCGNSAHGAPASDYPSGMVYVTYELVDRVCKSRDAECFAFSTYDGFPAREAKLREADFNSFR